MKTSEMLKNVAKEHGKEQDAGFIKAIATYEAREQAEEARLEAYRKASAICESKGHVWGLASGYQSLWDQGVDCPSQCRRCGEVEM